MADNVQKELIPGKQLVVRMQYDDAINVPQCYLDNLLSAIVKSLRGHSMLDYNVTLGARVNPEGAQNAKKDDVGCTQSQSQATDTPQACQNNCAGGGIIALTSSPTENYSYYAKTVLTTKPPNAPCLTILVEIFVNEKIDLSTDKDTQKTIIESVTEAINTCIIQKQKNPAAVRICVLNFVSSPNQDSKSKK